MTLLTPPQRLTSYLGCVWFL